MHFWISIVFMYQPANQPIPAPMVEAIVKGNRAYVQAACGQVDPTAINENGFSCLMLAVEHRQLGIAEVLLNCGYDVNFTLKFMPTPLYLAADHGDLKMVKLLLSHKADPYSMGIDSPLMVACEQGYFKIAKLLVTHGADVNVQVSGPAGDVRTPLLLARTAGHRKIAKVLRNHGAK